MATKEYTPNRITALKPNEIFVFGSNLAGAHGGGAARLAYDRFGAVWGQGVGLQGQSYAIPTMQGGVETIKPYVDEFIAFAKQHFEYKFLVTRIGCGIAAFTSNDIAPLFSRAIDLENVILPKDFVEVLTSLQDKTPTAAEETEAIRMWTMGAGNSAKRFNGEDPIPQKSEVATKDSWKNMPMPDKNVVIPLNVRIPCEAMRIIKYGHIPEAMEDHWFMYCDDEYIRYYRSWTGMCGFEAHYKKAEGCYVIDSLKMNHALAEFGVNGDEAGAALFCYLVIAESGGDADAAWQNYLNKWDMLVQKYSKKE